jgi:hypothetical protein
VETPDTLAARIGGVDAAMKRHVLSVGVAAVALSPAPAEASQLVFDCGTAFENLCRVRPDGTGLRRARA